jgi:hypothetical protein
MAIDLDKLELLAAQATPAPWTADNWSRVWYEPKQGVRRTVADCVRVTVKSPKRHRANARLIAAMHEALPELIAEHRALREKVRELERQKEEAVSYILSNEGASMIDCRMCFFVSSCECGPKQCEPNREMCEQAVRKVIEEAGE